MPRPVVCPHCQEELDIPADLRGRPVRCAACQKVFVPPAEPMSTPALPSPGNWAEDRPARRPTRADDLPVPQPAREVFDRTGRERDEFDDRAPWDERPVARSPKKRSKLWLWLLGLGFLGLCVLPCVGIFGLGAWVAFPDFQPHDSAEGRFRGEFPGQAYTYTEPTDDGATRHCTEYKRSFPPETYFVRYVDHPQFQPRETDRILKEAADRVARDTAGSEVSRTQGITDGYPSVDLAIQHSDGDMATIVRFLVVGTRLYEVGITGLVDPHGASDDPRVQHFLDAFKVQSPPVKEK